MEKVRGILTREGVSVAVVPADDVTLVFEAIQGDGETVAEKSETGPEPMMGFSVEQYYSINTTAEYSGRIEIRIICPLSMLFYTDVTKVKLWQYEKAGWKDLGARFVAKYNLIIGVTDHLSIFGVTR